ncbi:hypothetical protein B0H13DRAFT_1867059 [Mycena leptocephala]|nr:hypothetical protein B0H13DRAFT_1867059 [Mycena leptocephala]
MAKRKVHCYTTNQPEFGFERQDNYYTQIVNLLDIRLHHRKLFEHEAPSGLQRNISPMPARTSKPQCLQTSARLHDRLYKKKPSLPPQQCRHDVPLGPIACAPVYHLCGLGGSTTLGASVFDVESRSSHLEPIALSLVPAKTAVLQDEQTGDVDVSGPVRHPLTGMQDHTRRRAEADFAAHVRRVRTAAWVKQLRLHRRAKTTSGPRV